MSRRPKILLVDDEPSIIMGLARVLYQDNDRYDVLLAKSGEIAQEIIREVPISVLVTDINMPGMSGIDLICWAAAEWPEIRVVVMTALDVAQIRDQAYRLGCLQIVHKPFDLRAMRELVSSLLEREHTLSGRLSGLSLPDVIQMLCLGRQSTGMYIAQNENSGAVLIVNGEIVHAVWNSMEGEQALFCILAARDALFNTQSLPVEYPKSIDSNWQHLLMEGMRLIDEGRVPHCDAIFTPVPSKVPPPPKPAKRSPDADEDIKSEAGAMTPDDLLSAVEKSKKEKLEQIREQGMKASPEPKPKRAAVKTSQEDKAKAAELMDEGFAFMKAGDRVAARDCWQKALNVDPDNPMIKLNLKRLESMGID